MWVMVRHFFQEHQKLTSNANYFKIILQLKHPVICTEAAVFFIHPTFTPSCCHQPPACLSLLTWGTKIDHRRLHCLSGWHRVLFMVCGGVNFLHGHLSHFHITDSVKVRVTSASWSTCHPEESENLSSPCVGAEMCFCDSSVVCWKSCRRRSWVL